MPKETSYVQVENRGKGQLELNDGKTVIKLGSICDAKMFSGPCTLGNEVKAKDEDGNDDSTGLIHNPVKLVPSDLWAPFEKRPFVAHIIAEKRLSVTHPRG